MSEAEVLGARALGYLAGDPDLFGTFLTETGLTLRGIRSAADEPGFLAGVLEFLSRHEKALVGFASAERIRPDRILAAQQLLADGSALEGGYVDVY